MLEAKDILYIVIAFCILWFTIFLSWAIYYIAMILKEVKIIIGDARKKMELIDGLLKGLKNKVESTSSHMKLLVETVVNVAEFIKDRKKEGSKKKK